MAKLVTVPLTSLTNEISAVNNINNNFDAVETAMENTLSRDGTSPNQMEADIDLNGHDLLNTATIEAETLVLSGVPLTPAVVFMTEGDKGDIVVSGGGDTWTIDSTVLSPFMRTVLDDANAADVRTTIDAQQSDATLTALAGFSSVGLMASPSTDTFVARTLTAPAAGLTITNPDGAAGNPTFALADDLAGIEAITGTGLVARTAGNTYTPRTLTGTANQLTVTNGDGIAGNPTISVPATLDYSGKTWTNAGTVTTIDINGGTIDGTDIGTSVRGSAQFTTINGNGLATFGNGLTFGGSTLATYIQGTGTAQLQFGGANVGLTTSTSTFNYTRIGNITVGTVKITLTAVGSSTGSATITLSGLPGVGGSAAGIWFARYQNLTGLTGMPHGRLTGSSPATITLLQSAAASSTALTQTAFTATTDLEIGFAFLN